MTFKNVLLPLQFQLVLRFLESAANRSAQAKCAGVASRSRKDFPRSAFLILAVELGQRHLHGSAELDGSLEAVLLFTPVSGQRLDRSVDRFHLKSIHNKIGIEFNLIQVITSQESVFFAYSSRLVFSQVRHRFMHRKEICP